MTSYTHQTAPTQFTEAGGIRFAYRRFGKKGRLPLLSLRANFLNWIPRGRRSSI